MKNYFRITLITAATAILLPALEPVKQPDVCYSCHEKEEGLLKKESQHPSFKKGKCSDCHNSHATRHKGLLNQNTKSLCISCHEDFNKLVLQPNHCAPIKEKDCMKCHLSHASDNPPVLASPYKNLCASCHEDVKNWPENKKTHEPVAKGDCKACHTPCISEKGEFLKKKVPELCWDCHKPNQKFNQSHSVADAKSLNCQECHDSHFTGNKTLLHTNLHKPFTEKSCQECHKSEKTIPLAPLKEEKNNDCLSCHEKYLPVDTLPLGHTVKNKTSCSDCHSPHASPTEALLKDKPNELCITCHFQDITTRKKTKHATHPGAQCNDCHDAHATDNRRYLKNSGEGICNKCHDGSHKSTHPAGKDVIDPRDNTPVNCVSCHQLHGPKYPDYLPNDPKMELCLQCHKM